MLIQLELFHIVISVHALQDRSISTVKVASDVSQTDPFREDPLLCLALRTKVRSRKKTHVLQTLESRSQNLPPGAVSWTGCEWKFRAEG